MYDDKTLESVPFVCSVRSVYTSASGRGVP